MTSAEFDAAVAKVNGLKVKPSDEQLLKIYGLFKQATVGKNTTEKPGMFDLKGKYKWEAWNENGDMSKEEAEKKYIEIANTL